MGKQNLWEEKQIDIPDPSLQDGPIPPGLPWNTSLGKENMSDSLTWWIYKFLQFFLVTKQYERNLHNNSLK